MCIQCGHPCAFMRRPKVDMQISTSIASLYSFIQDRVSHWTWVLLFGLDWPTSKPGDLPVSTPNAGEIGTHRGQTWLFYLGAQVPNSGPPAYTANTFSMKHLPSLFHISFNKDHIYIFLPSVFLVNSIVVQHWIFFSYFIKIFNYKQFFSNYPIHIQNNIPTSL